ncbi:MAG TPA: FoF1 ATP synthase subunit a [Spirochaetia bacterium]|nr:FoF1 ATP synthase subunit a [Spirochaetia bacterium]
MSAEAGALTISERITEAVSIKTVFTVKAFGLAVPISDTVVATWIVMAVLVLSSFLLTRRLKDVPGKAQSLVEGLVAFANKFAEDNIGHEGRRFVPFIGTVFLFLCVANLLPMLTPVGGFGYEPPFAIKPLTRDINVTSALAVLTMAVVVFSALRRKGLKGFLRSFARPMAFMAPFNALEYAVKPLSLSLRLFGNVLGAFIIMQLVEIVMPVGLPPILGLYFDLFDGLVQAVVFGFLSAVYVAEAIE